MNSRHSQRYISFFLSVIIVLSLCLVPSGTARAKETPIKIAVFELNGFYERGEDGAPHGYGIDYLEKISEETHWVYDYVWAENWDECVELLRQGSVDFIAPAEKTSDRIKEFQFSAFSIGMECGALLALDTNEKLIYEDFQSFNEISIGYVDSTVFSNAFTQYASDNGFTPHLVSYRDTKALMSALNAGEVDSALVNLFAKTDTTKVLAKFGAAPFYLMTDQHHSELLSQLNDTLQQIKLEFTAFEADLAQLYYPAFNETPFTKEELDYIGSAPVFKVACRTGIAPISDGEAETDKVTGITKRILDEISQYSGLQFEYFALPQNNITYDYLRQQKISLVSGVEYNTTNTKVAALNLTIPYFDSKKVFVYPSDEIFDASKKMKLAVATGSRTLLTALKREYPHFEVLRYDNIEESFEAVHKGTADALLQNQYVITSYLARPIYSNMNTAPVEGMLDRMCLSPVINQKKGGTTDPLLSDERLISILNKSIRQLSEEKRSRIHIEETNKNQYQYTVGDFLYLYRYPLIAIALILILLLFLLIYIIKMKQANIRTVMESEATLTHITSNINGGVVVLAGGDELRITYANEGFLELMQCRREDYEKIKNQQYSTYVHPDDVEELYAFTSSDMVKRDLGRISLKLRIARKDGSYIPTLFNGTVTVSADGELEIFCVIMDISVQEKLLDKISMEEKRYRTLIENSDDIIFEINGAHKQLNVSPLFEYKFGWKLRRASLSNVSIDAMHLLRIHDSDLLDMERLTERVFDEQQNVEVQVRIRKTDGEYLWCRIYEYPMIDDYKNVVSVLGKILDVDNEVRTKAELEHKSRTDALTGLLNKSAFFSDAETYLTFNAGKHSAIVFIDLDNFKQLNDCLGHLDGDIALKDVAKKLQVIFSHYDLVGRFGGDEFCVLVKDIPEDTLRDKLEWTVEKLHTLYAKNGQTVQISSSIGAVFTNGEKESLSTLLERADKALYQAKEGGKNQYVIYHE